MRVKELRELLAQADDNAIVVVESKSTDTHINLVAEESSICGNIVYLSSVQNFPQDWYDEDGVEIGYDYLKNYGWC